MRLAASIAALALVAACAGNSVPAPDILPPEVTLTQIGMRNAGLLGGTLDTKVTIRNPNSTVIRGTGLTLALDVEGHRFGSTDWVRGFELAGDSTVSFVVPVDFTWRTVGLAARSVLNFGDVRYAVSGRTHLLIAGRIWHFPYSKEGHVALVRIP